MSKIHSGHQGIVRCRLRIAESVWWPGASREMENFVRSCPECQKNTPPSKEPLIPSELPKHPWEKVASDLFELDKTNYILVVDYFSRYVEVQRLTSTSASSVIAALKSNFFSPRSTICIGQRQWSPVIFSKFFHFFTIILVAGIIPSPMD